MDKHVAREALKNKGFYQEQHGMLLIQDNELIRCYQQLLKGRGSTAATTRTDQSPSTR